ncbi:MAG: DNA repair protein RadA, partial [Pseudomonadota bacterium]
MAKARTQFICQSCGAVSSRWQGKCDSCGEWNTLVEENPSAGIGASPSGRAMRKGSPVALVSLAGEIEEAPRLATGISEFDRVTGGGLVNGSAILVGGDPGIGKSTLLMQASAAIARNGHDVVYVSGEEAVAQIRLRARRLDAIEARVGLAAETSVENILATLDEASPPALLIIDSIQTLWTDLAESAPGTVTQVRASAQALIRHAKKTGTAVVLVGHVTKEGQIAGPRVVEHMVDAVLTFEGDPSHAFRLLRGVKNRFGPTD